VTVILINSFLQHLKIKHPTESKLCEDYSREEQVRVKKAKLGRKVDENQQLIDGMLNKTQKYPKTSSRQKQLDNCLLDMLAKDLQPASVVEDQGFIKFVNLLDPRYEIPSRRTIMRMLPTKYDKLKQRIFTGFDQVKCVSLTTELWTSRATE